MEKWAGEFYNGEDNYIMEQSVSDNNIVTANGTAALEFAKEVMITLKITTVFVPTTDSASKAQISSVSQN